MFHLQIHKVFFRMLSPLHVIGWRFRMDNCNIYIAAWWTVNRQLYFFCCIKISYSGRPISFNRWEEYKLTYWTTSHQKLNFLSSRNRSPKSYVGDISNLLQQRPFTNIFQFSSYAIPWNDQENKIIFCDLAG